MAMITGASLIGKSHEQMNLPNQDYFLIRQRPLFSFFVVADGVGTDKHADVGAKSICYSVKKNCWKLALNRTYAIDKLLSQIYKSYVKSIPKKCKGSVGTTCIFVCICKERTLICQAGDGVACYRTDDGFFILEKDQTKFTNEVNAINDKRPFTEWQYIELATQSISEILIATDGIADDIIPDKISGFMDYVVKKTMAETSLTLRTQVINDMLVNWITPRSIDDKTLVVFRRDTIDE